MIYYKTISLNPVLDNEVVTINNVSFTMNPSSDEDFPVKVKVEKENETTLTTLQNTDGVVILTESEFNSL